MAQLPITIRTPNDAIRAMPRLEFLMMIIDEWTFYHRAKIIAPDWNKRLIHNAVVELERALERTQKDQRITKPTKPLA